ncbi:MAG: TIGR04066 family peptide maturation system protein [Lachnospiraceae bacterium]|nr:TIGR04066 family peptide maturation system protein [Lachnospiraceae bacterium]
MKAVVYPYDFEFISTLKCRSILKDIEIVYLLSPMGFGISGKDGYYLQDENSGFTIKSELNNDEYANIDTLIITESILKLPVADRMGEIESVLSKCSFAINLVYGNDFSKAVGKLCQEKNVKLIDNFDLIGSQKAIDLNRVGLPSERNRISTPVVAICGLAPMTQKFDLQLYFRNHLLRNGYKVSQIGTKLNSQLFGFHTWGEALYDNRFTEVEKIAKINQLVKDIELVEKPDVFIIGIPDAIVPYTHKHTFRYGIPAFEIFNAVSPDYTVLSLFNGEYTDEFYEEMIKVCNYKFNIDIDCFYNSHFVPVSLSINANDLSYSLAEKKSAVGGKYQVFNSESIESSEMYDYMIESLKQYGQFKSY